MKLGNLIAFPFALVADAVSLGQAGVTRRVFENDQNEQVIEAVKAAAELAKAQQNNR
jgi:hypothetical protein